MEAAAADAASGGASSAASMAAMGLPVSFTDNRLSGALQQNERRAAKRAAAGSAGSCEHSEAEADDESAPAVAASSSAVRTAAASAEHTIAASAGVATAADAAGDLHANGQPVDAASSVAAPESRTAAKKRRKLEAANSSPENGGGEAAAAAGDSHALNVCVAGPSTTFDTPAYVGRKKKNNNKGKKKDDGLAALARENNTEVKYWAQRYTYFSLFDLGCKLDRVGWFSVTPELIASHQAERCRCDTIIDAYAGVGGNTIQFALTCYHVIAIELDPARLELIRHNARIYGVEDRIEFICGDYLTLIPKLKADVVFLAPPWGGIEYNNVDYFDIETMIQPSGFDIFRRSLSITPNIAFCLPRNCRPEQVQEMASLTPIGSSASVAETPLACELEENFVGGKLKMLTAYFHQLVVAPPDSPAETGEEATPAPL